MKGGNEMKNYNMLMMLRGIAEIFRSGQTGNIYYNDILSYEDSLFVEDTLDLKKISKEKAFDKNDNDDRFLVKNFDIIYPIKQKDHKPKLVTLKNSSAENITAVYGPEIIIVRPISEIIDSKFLFLLLNSSIIQKNINQQAEKLTPNRITCDMIGKIMLNIPDISEQIEMIEELEKFNKQKIEIERKIQKYATKSE